MLLSLSLSVWNKSDHWKLIDVMMLLLEPVFVCVCKTLCTTNKQTKRVKCVKQTNKQKMDWIIINIVKIESRSIRMEKELCIKINCQNGWFFLPGLFVCRRLVCAIIHNLFWLCVIWYIIYIHHSRVFFLRNIM